jgi:glycosyltransferase involved in cell wall biosynthesis
MRILIISQYFWPESFIINQISKTLVLQGHQVVVLTGKPNYPDGIIYSEYQQKGVQHQRIDGVEVIRVPMRPRKSGSGKDLILNYLSFIMSGLLRFPSLVKGRHFDVIFVFAPSPITSVLPAIFLKYIKRTHLAVWVQDLWPESLAATGFIKNKAALKIVSYLVQGIYACSDTLLVQSHAFMKPLSLLSKQDKIQYFPNSIDDMQQQMINGDNNGIPKSLQTLLDTNFCLVFAGNIGKAQSIETIISAAVKLKSRFDIKIVFVGKGSMLEWAQQEVSRLHLENVVFAGAFPMDVMPVIFSKAEVLLVSLKSDEIFSYTIPSKIQAYMSAGRPIIASINGEAARIINEAGAGLTCSAEDVDGLVVCVQQIITRSENERARFGLAGRDYFLKNFEMKSQCNRLVEILEQRISNEKAV